MSFFRALFNFNKPVKKVAEKKIKVYEKKEDFPSSTFSAMPADAKSIIASFSSREDLLNTAQINKEFYREAKSEKNIEDLKFYFAVGQNIYLYEQQVNSFGFYSVKRKIQKQTMELSLHNKLLLFSDGETACQYARFSAFRTFDVGSDLFVPDDAPGVFIVQVLQNNPYYLKKVTVQATEHIPDCPAPPVPKEMKDFALKTSRSNIKIHYSKLQGGMFKHHSEGRFADIWSEAVELKNTFQEIAIAGITAVFSSYFVWHAFLTRHHQEGVQRILDKMRTNPSLEELTIFMTSYYNEAVKAEHVNKSGHFMQMLTFTMAELNALKEINQMPGIKAF